MTERYETKPETHDVKRCVERTCDLCGKKSEQPESEDWGRGLFNVARTTLELVEGKRFPEGRQCTTTKFDICPACFVEKLVPWMESQGAKATVEED